MSDLESLKAAHTAAYLAAQDADAIFSAQLVRQFGKAAGDRRYDAARPGWDDATKAAGDAYVAASQGRHAAWLALGEAEKAAAPAAWPTHPDGRPMKLGELPRETQIALTREACGRIKAELEHPARQDAFRKILEG